MAKQIIILEANRTPGAPGMDLRFVFWFAIPPARRIPLPVIDPMPSVSAYRDATQAEIAALLDGSVLEEVYNTKLVRTTASEVKTMLEAKYEDRKADLAASPSPTQFYGSSWDGTSWTQ